MLRKALKPIKPLLRELAHKTRPIVAGSDGVCKVNPSLSLAHKGMDNLRLDDTYFLRCILNNINGAPAAFPGCHLTAEHQHVLLACFPKSGSTFLIQLM